MQGAAEARDRKLDRNTRKETEANANRRRSHWRAITAKREEQIECETFERARTLYIVGFYDFSA